jgi:predicted metal-dependent peptidase
MSQARSRLILKFVFYACLALNTRFIADKSVKTAETDMKTIWYNPTWVAKLTVAQTMGLAVHELLHIMFKHGLRRGSRDPKLWNIACDHVVNLLIIASNLELPPNGYADKKYSGMSAEQIYPLLKDESGDGGIGQDLRELGPMDEGTKRELEQRIDTITTQAVTQAKMAGDMPAHLARLVQGVLHPPINWARLLADYMTRLARDETSWNRRNRRYSNVYMPGRHSVSMGEICISVDTSGSIGNSELAQVAREINEIAEQVKPERIRVTYVDADVAGEQMFERGEKIVFEPKGGGGTDMRKACAHMALFDPIVGVIITDGHTPWDTKPPPYPLIIVCTTSQKCPSYAYIVRMN